jgi:hypothetical protein
MVPATIALLLFNLASSLPHIIIFVHSWLTYSFYFSFALTQKKQKVKAGEIAFNNALLRHSLQNFLRRACHTSLLFLGWPLKNFAHTGSRFRLPLSNNAYGNF